MKINGNTEKSDFIWGKQDNCKNINIGARNETDEIIHVRKQIFYCITKNYRENLENPPKKHCSWEMELISFHQ